MEFNKFLKFLKSFNNENHTDKNFFIWNGNYYELLELLNNANVNNISLDIFDLLNTEDINFEEIDINKYIYKKLNFRLKELFDKYSSNIILVVSSVYVLARYNIPLTPFFNHFISDKNAIILQIEKYCFDEKFPNNIIFKPDVTIEYAINILGLDNLILEEKNEFAPH